MRVLLAAAALTLLATFAPLALYAPPAVPPRPVVAFAPVPLDAGAPSRRRLGNLLYLEGWAMSSNHPDFGGISAMHVEDGAVLALSDAGSIISFDLPGASTTPVTIKRLRDGPGTPTSKLDRDTEAMVVAGPDVWIGYERHNAIWRYRRDDWRSVSAATPHRMRRWPENAGSEAMLRLRDGNFLVFSEGQMGHDGSAAAVLFKGDPARPETPAVRLRYRAPAGYRITDAALLPDGRILFLNRRFTVTEGVSAKLTLSDPPRLFAGAVIEGREIAHFAPPVTVDNLEALSVEVEDGRPVIWIASDDNFSGMQRSLLLKFALADDGKRERAP